MIAVALGDLERAVTFLREFAEVTRGEGVYPWLHAEPHFEPLWDHPTFLELIRPKG